MDSNLIGKKEEITDLFGKHIYEEKDEETDKYVFHVGRVLRFKFEGSLTCIRITKIDRKNKRMWGVHTQLMEYNRSMSHYGHIIDATDDAVKQYGAPYCSDCEVPVNQPSTEDGEVKAADRRDRTLSDGTEIPNA